MIPFGDGPATASTNNAATAIIRGPPIAVGQPLTTSGLEQRFSWEKQDNRPRSIPPQKQINTPLRKHRGKHLWLDCRLNLINHLHSC